MGSSIPKAEFLAIRGVAARRGHVGSDMQVSLSTVAGYIAMPQEK
jgi:hypothetical protein